MENMYEYAGNLHTHTVYSDGTTVHGGVAAAAAKAGLDFVVTTDHNVWVNGCEGYYDGVLLLIGEEVHDVRRDPQGNHLLAYGVDKEVVSFASDSQELIDHVKQQGGFAYLAHPVEYGKPRVGGEPLPWGDWDVTGYTGLEIWNYMSEFKARLHTKLGAIIYAYLPTLAIRGPFTETLRRWDELLAAGKRVAAIGGADAHAKTYSLGPLTRVIFPYEHLFRAINTHVLTEHRLNGSLERDKALIYEALRAGHTWVGYDGMASTEGFRFRARSGTNEAIMGGELVRHGAVNFTIHTPQRADTRLIRTGQLVAQRSGVDLTVTTAEPGAYRVEVYRRYRGGRRGWIFSSPIYVV